MKLWPREQHPSFVSRIRDWRLATNRLGDSSGKKLWEERFGFGRISEGATAQWQEAARVGRKLTSLSLFRDISLDTLSSTLAVAIGREELFSLPFWLVPLLLASPHPILSACWFFSFERAPRPCRRR